jgi:hypothetical protein
LELRDQEANKVYGYDGSSNVISAVIQAKTITDSRDPRFNFLLSNGVGNQRPNRMTIIGQTGNVGIGITDPTEKMDVDGSIRMREGAMAGYILVSDADGKMTWTDPSTIMIATDTDWLMDGDGELYGAYMGEVIDSPDGHRLNVQNYLAGKAAVRGVNQNSLGMYSEGQLGLFTDQFGDNPLGLPLLSNNIGVFGFKPANGAKGTAIYGWNNDDNLVNHAGVFIADGIAVSGTNYGLYASAANGATNWAGYFAEGNVYVQNRVGINNENPSAYLDIGTDAATATRAIEATVNYVGEIDVIAINTTSIPSGGWGYGVHATGGFRGVYGVGNGGSATGTVFGVQGYAVGTAGTRYGIYGFASGGTTNYAGYFAGNTTVTGTFTNPSDRKMKQNIALYTDALEVIQQLETKTYDYKKGEFAGMGLSSQPQIGFIAQEVEKVLPNLVTANVHPEEIEHDEEGNRVILREAINYKGINYIGLIPVLTQGIKELTIENQELKSSLADVTKQLSELTELMNDKFNQMEEDMSSCCLSETDNKTGSANTNVELNAAAVPTLEQNTPNPFYEQTVIKYYIPSIAKNARMTITDMKGSPIKSVNLTDTGLGIVTIHENELPIGTYVYTLFVDGKQVESKQMILVK